jgi:hypothetical protein
MYRKKLGGLKHLIRLMDPILPNPIFILMSLFASIRLVLYFPTLLELASMFIFDVTCCRPLLDM